MSNVQVGPPNLAEADKRAVSLAKFLRHNKDIQQRQGILNGKRQDFFRVKRAVRALQSDAYKKAQRKDANLPELNTREDALEAFRLLPLNRLAFRVIKLETEEAKSQGLKPVRGVPVLNIYPQQEFGDDMYYTWFYDPVEPITYVYAVLALIGIFAVVMFPLWPQKLRVGVWYLSMGMLCLLGLFFGIAIVRLILFMITWVVAKPGLWLFPNLFEDVGFVDSFIPLWAWHGVNCLPGANKNKTNKKQRNLGYTEEEKAKRQEEEEEEDEDDDDDSNEATQQLQQQKMQELAMKVQKRYDEIKKGPNAPKTEQEDTELKQKLLHEEAEKIKAELSQAAAAQESRHTHSHDDGHGHSHSHGPRQRIVTLEDDDDDE